MFRNIKRVNCIKAQSFLVDGFYRYSKYPKSFFIKYSSINEHKKLKQVPKYDFNKL